MQKKIFLLAMFIVIACCGLASAAVDRVVFYPSGADYTQQLRADIRTDVNGYYVLFTLSGQAEPDTFSIASLTKGVAVNDVSWSRSDLSQSPAAIETGKKIDQLKFKLDTVVSQRQAVQGGIMFWQERSKIQQTKSTELGKIADLVVSNLSKLYAQSAKLDMKIKELKDLIDELRRKLAEITGQGKRVWNVKVSVAAKGTKSAVFKVSYMLRNCGWTPKYKLDAYPATNKLKFTFEAEIRQGSGVDFNKCQIALATVKKRSRISPPNLQKWIIEPVVEEDVVVMERANYAAKSMMVADMAPSPAPRRVSKATYSLWEMGIKSIPAGTIRKYAVEDESWNVEYSFLTRPSISHDVFVSAKAVLKEARDYSAGPALIFMEGAMIGKRGFAFSGTEKTVYFGSDPMLKAERKTLEKRFGEKGMFGSKQTYNWKYLIELKSSRKTPVRVKVQEAAPVSGDKRIKLTVGSKPKAKVKDNKFEWLLDVPAKGKASLEYNVDMEAPDDMKIDFGLGR
ncbi:DUF4139 domain-containing protein [Maridesulfovibrio hydrothermalis]|uniref:DUF4139 domain-containing protein n=1 Tax=Maridesulfovibrio hydrothermalis AM13 = DSM 14728 TaxID=1121451 RepID=L0RCK9_9BACT|nr:DUF4139 domain-containing protein [Maridesulfovibrio hydrothermalis]CCO24484.1 conserved exported protein of unknown function [Maridesulfovibrio hydrothermalis AM13 = DSM 14728]